MNLALPALVVFLLLLPGFIARSRIKRAERLSLDYSPFGQIVTEAVVWAAGLHIAGVLALHHFSHLRVQPDIALRLLSSDPQAQARALDAVAGQAGAVTAYWAGLIAFAYLGPTAVRAFISWRRLDRNGSRLSPLLRFSGAPWYYLLSGADFRREDEPDLIAISAIVDVANTPYLYTGILDDYFLDTEGRLDRLILQQVMRRPLDRDKAEGRTEPDLDRFYAVDGDYFVLRYAEAITLNVEYIKLPPGDARSARVLEEWQQDRAFAPTEIDPDAAAH